MFKTLKSLTQKKKHFQYSKHIVIINFTYTDIYQNYSNQNDNFIQLD